ncbi:Transcription factor bHLH92 [Triticum urartu]|uniref:Transcription factor bHLH92 n=1 Tax=Triticum urartu TaxID=4572 RepID=M7ZKN8_TRIUA|nr:Transcription factor bHLH92 [Triticum urartu]
MQMDSYYFHDDAHFFAGCGVPGSPDLPFADLIASLWEPLPEVASQSACRQYRGVGLELPGTARGGTGNGINIHRRMMDVLGRMGPATEEEERPQHQQQQAAGAVESSRGFRHMMRERQRREKLSQSYADLHAMVSSRSKVLRPSAPAVLPHSISLVLECHVLNERVMPLQQDKNSIVQSAAVYIHELKVAKEQLQRRNDELKAKILGHDAQQQCVKVQFEVDEPSSSIDSMIGALTRLKSMNVKTRGIHSILSGQRLTTEMNVETTIAACEVEKAVEEALQEVERNQLPDSEAPFPGSRSAWPQTSHVQNVF